jgi:uncharacterized protein (DUF983 family)
MSAAPNQDPGVAGKRPWTESLLVALLRQRCPRCRQGRMFRGMFTMNDPCPVCGLVFEREPGYYFGAMYFSYFMGVGILVPSYFFFNWLLPDWPGPAVVFLSVLPYLPLVPLVFQYSRVIWTYFDRIGSISESSSHTGFLQWREAQRRGGDTSA